MTRKTLFALSAALALGAAALSTTSVTAEPAKDSKAPTEMKLPPGWTEQDVQAMVAAGTPGKMHELLAQSVGTWSGSDYTGVQQLVRKGRNNGTWNGAGLLTSLDNADVSSVTTLAVAAAGDIGKTTFAGRSVASDDVCRYGTTIRWPLLYG